KAAAERGAAAITRRVAIVEGREANATEKLTKLDAIKLELNQREAALERREEALKAKESALALRQKTVEANEAAVAAARATLAAAQAAVDNALAKAKQDEEAAAVARAKATQDEAAAAGALAKAKQAEDAATIHQGAATQAAADAAEAKKVAEDAKAEAERLRLDAQAQLERQKADHDLHERQLGLLARAVDDENGLELRLSDSDGFRMQIGKMTEAETQAFKAPWAASLLRAGRRIAAALVQLRNKLEKITAREEAVAEKEKEVASLLAVVKNNQAEIEEEVKHQVALTSLLNTAITTAQAFMKRWYNLPESERGKEIELTLEAAEKLPADWPPADYDPRKERGGR
ncbi:MAG TPA: hypothetical protein VF614_00020, partial [Chthoniobacteraceae bacterium]